MSVKILKMFEYNGYKFQINFVNAQTYVHLHSVTILFIHYK